MPPVNSRTVPLTWRIRVLTSKPGVTACSIKAVVKGLLRPWPSAATSPGLVAKTIMLPLPRPLMAASPRLEELRPLVKNGLSRQASITTMLKAARLRSIAAVIRSTLRPWSMSSYSSSMSAPTGIM